MKPEQYIAIPCPALNGTKRYKHMYCQGIECTKESCSDLRTKLEPYYKKEKYFKKFRSIHLDPDMMPKDIMDKYNVDNVKANNSRKRGRISLSIDALKELGMEELI